MNHDENDLDTLGENESFSDANAERESLCPQDECGHCGLVGRECHCSGGPMIAPDGRTCCSTRSA